MTISIRIVILRVMVDIIESYAGLFCTNWPRYYQIKRLPMSMSREINYLFILVWYCVGLLVRGLCVYMYIYIGYSWLNFDVGHHPRWYTNQRHVVMKSIWRERWGTARMHEHSVLSTWLTMFSIQSMCLLSAAMFLIIMIMINNNNNDNTAVYFSHQQKKMVKKMD